MHNNTVYFLAEFTKNGSYYSMLRGALSYNIAEFRGQWGIVKKSTI